MQIKLHQYEGFLDFIREQGVVGLAVGFVLGSSISKIVSSLVGDIINPFINIILGATGNFKDNFVSIGGVDLRWGNFLGSIVDFLVIAFVIYLLVKILGVEKLDKKRGK